MTSTAFYLLHCCVRDYPGLIQFVPDISAEKQTCGLRKGFKCHLTVILLFLMPKTYILKTRNSKNLNSLASMFSLGSVYFGKFGTHPKI